MFPNIGFDHTLDIPDYLYRAYAGKIHMDIPKKVLQNNIKSFLMSAFEVQCKHGTHIIRCNSKHIAQA